MSWTFFSSALALIPTVFSYPGKYVRQLSGAQLWTQYGRKTPGCPAVMCKHHCTAAVNKKAPTVMVE